MTFTKDCTNYSIASDGRSFLATLVRVPELDGEFLEVETQAAEDDLPAALAGVRALMGALGVSEDELTTDTYTAAVMAARTKAAM